MNKLNKEVTLQKEIENEIDNMTFEELLYLQMNPNLFIYNKLKPQIENLKQIWNELKFMEEDLNSIKNKKLEDNNELKQQFINYNNIINRLIQEKNNLESKESKSEFINLLDKEIKNFDSPVECFNRFKDGKSNYDEFQKEFSELGKGKRYFYYKLMRDKINS